MKTTKSTIKVNEEIRALRYQMSQMLEHLGHLEIELEQSQALTSETVDILVNVFLDLVLEETKGEILEPDRLRLKKKFEDLQKKWLRP